MSSTRKGNKWLLVQWGSGSRSVVDMKSVISPTYDSNVVGTVVVADKGNGTHEAATVICSARDRGVLEQQISPKATVNDDDEDAGPSKIEEGEDFSASGGSSWAPSDENCSTDEEEIGRKKIKQELANTRNSRVMRPSHRADAINQILESRKRTHNGEIANVIHKNFVPDSTKQNAALDKSDIVSINVRDIMDMKQCFHDLFQLIKEMKYPDTAKPCNNSNKSNALLRVKQEANNTKISMETFNENESDASDRSRSEDLNRSDDNVLITNKYDNASKVLVEQNQNITVQGNESEFVPIGSGKTMIHISQFSKINWKSYTVATRTLLLAVFPRRILATHSLTGKKSPAFYNKPPKMCLDPKIVSDVIIEITERFGVKENLVRSIITTKCADECKMLKTRQQRKTLNLTSRESGAKNIIKDDPNQTC